jgi:predicted transcriptional regulator
VDEQDPSLEIFDALKLLEDFWREVYPVLDPWEWNDESIAERNCRNGRFQGAYHRDRARRRAESGRTQIWFSSAQSIGKLIDENWPLLQDIRRHAPQSRTEFAARSGRSLSNLSRSLKSLEARRLVRLRPGRG